MKGSCLEFQKAALVLLTEPGMRGHLGQEAEKRHPGEGQVLGPAWKTHMSNLGCRWHVRRKTAIGYYTPSGFLGEGTS